MIQERPMPPRRINLQIIKEVSLLQMIVQKKRAFQRIKEPEDQNQAIRKAKANDLAREEEFQTLKEGLARLIKENRKS